MLGMGFFEILIIAGVALVVVGPKRLPDFMRQAGRLFVHLRRTANDVRATFDQVVREAEDEIRREEALNLHKTLKPLLDLGPTGSEPSALQSPPGSAETPAGTQPLSSHGPLASGSQPRPSEAPTNQTGGTSEPHGSQQASTSGPTAQGTPTRDPPNEG